MSVGSPIPRLTYWPGRRSRAARAAICSRVRAISLHPWAAGQGRVMRYSMELRPTWGGASSTTLCSNIPDMRTWSGLMPPASTTSSAAAASSCSTAAQPASSRRKLTRSGACLKCLASHLPA